MPFHDNWWQTETGGIMIANFASMDIRPGSMGRPVPGVTAAIVRRTDTGVEEVAGGEEGELALEPGWPAMFRAYLHDDERHAEGTRCGYMFRQRPHAPRTASEVLDVERQGRTSISFNENSCRTYDRRTILA